MILFIYDIYLSLAYQQVHKAQDIASRRGKLLTEDFLFLIRKVPYDERYFFSEHRLLA